MTKKIIYIIIIVILIIAGIIAAKKISNKDSIVETISNTISIVNNEENILIENEEEVVEAENEDIEENTIKTDVIEKPEDKAKKIVQNNWGEDDTVYYSFDGIDASGAYIICVRDKNSTKALYFYYVDVETGNFEIR